MDNDVALLHQKIDYLTEQFEAQRRRHQAADELKQDLIPIANQFVKLAIDELAEIGSDFELEDLLFLLKRMLRNTHTWLKLIDRLEAGMGLADEAGTLGKQVFASAVETLDGMERQGYFAFARGGLYVVDRMLSEFGEEDVRALGDNIVTILKTVRNMTQPEVLAMVNNAVDVMREEEPGNGNVSTWALLRELSNPRVRKGLARMLNVVKAMADQPQPGNVN